MIESGMALSFSASLEIFVEDFKSSFISHLHTGMRRSWCFIKPTNQTVLSAVFRRSFSGDLERPLYHMNISCRLLYLVHFPPVPDLKCCRIHVSTALTEKC